MKISGKWLCAVALMWAIALPGFAADKTIKMGTLPWQDVGSISLMTKQVLEDAGYKVKVTKFDEWGIAFAALRKGDVQILATLPEYVAHEYWNRYKSRLEKISPVMFGLYQDLAVPKYVDIDSIEQLNEHADEFDGKIIGIEPGSGVMQEAEKAVKAYGLKLKLVDGSTAAMTAALKSATQRKAPNVVTLWDTSWMFPKYDMKFLKDPKHIFAPHQTYYWIAHKGFSQKHPQAREAIASIFVPFSAIKQISLMVNDGMDRQKAVSKWMKNNSERVKRWENVQQN